MNDRFSIAFISEAAYKEYLSFKNPTKSLIDKGLNRLRSRADVIGKPLTGILKGCRELKFRADGIRIIYRIVGSEIEIVEIIAIGKREKGDVFRSARKRLDC